MGDSALSTVAAREHDSALLMGYLNDRKPRYPRILV